MSIEASIEAVVSENRIAIETIEGEGFGVLFSGGSRWDFVVIMRSVLAKWMR